MLFLKHDSKPILTVFQPCMWFMEEPIRSPVGQTAQSLTCSNMEKPHAGLEDCLNMLLSCFRTRMSVLFTHLGKSLGERGEGTLRHPASVCVLHVVDGEHERAPVDLASVVVEEEVKDNGDRPHSSKLGQVERELRKAHSSMGTLGVCICFGFCQVSTLGRPLSCDISLSIFDMFCWPVG